MARAPGPHRPAQGAHGLKVFYWTLGLPGLPVGQGSQVICGGEDTPNLREMASGRIPGQVPILRAPCVHQTCAGPLALGRGLRLNHQSAKPTLCKGPALANSSSSPISIHFPLSKPRVLSRLPFLEIPPPGSHFLQIPPSIIARTPSRLSVPLLTSNPDQDLPPGSPTVPRLRPSSLGPSS